MSINRLSVKLKIIISSIILTSGILPPFAHANDGMVTTPKLHALNGVRIADTNIGFNAASHKGKKVLLMFWKHDCAPCLVEMAGFQNIRKAAGNMPIYVITPTYGKKEKYLLQKPIQYSAKIIHYKGDYDQLLEYYGDPEGGVPYSVMMDGNGEGCISNLGPINAKVMKDMFAECK